MSSLIGLAAGIAVSAVSNSGAVKSGAMAAAAESAAASSASSGVTFGENEGADWLRTGSGLSFEEYWGTGPYGATASTGQGSSPGASSSSPPPEPVPGPAKEPQNPVIDETSTTNTELVINGATARRPKRQYDDI